MRLGVLLQYDAVELSHAAEPENEQWRIADAFRMEPDIALFVMACAVQVWNCQVFRAFSVLAFGFVFEYFGKQRGLAVVRVENGGIQIALPCFAS